MIEFWNRVDQSSSCWPWLGCTSKTGFGVVKVKGVVKSAHRVAFELVNGPIPIGHQIRQSCENRACCNPAHLIAVPPKLSADDVQAIRASKLPYSILGKLYGVDPGTISRVARYESHV